jgi:hypothetical protein
MQLATKVKVASQQALQQVSWRLPCGNHAVLADKTCLLGETIHTVSLDWNSSLHASVVPSHTSSLSHSMPMPVPLSLHTEFAGCMVWRRGDPSCTWRMNAVPGGMLGQVRPCPTARIREACAAAPRNMPCCPAACIRPCTSPHGALAGPALSMCRAGCAGTAATKQRVGCAVAQLL